MRDNRLEETAFPSDSHFSIGPDGSKWPYSPGMSLRDYFAAQALYCVSQKTNGYDPQWLAMTAYVLADAMLAERTK